MDPARLAETWDRLAERRRARGAGPRGRKLLASGLALAAAALAVAVLRWPEGPPRALAAEDGSVSVAPGAVVAASPAPAVRELALDDGSTVDLDDRARMEVLANDGRRFVTLLDGGPARFEVTPGGPRTWTIETALASVEVVGTAFTVDPSPERLEVVVSHGVVLVRGERVPGRVARLEAGQRLVVDAAPPVEAVVQPPPAPLAVAAAPREEVPVALAPAEPVAPFRDPPSVDAPRVPPALPVTEGLVEADRLRAEGRVAEAADVLERSILADPHGPGSGLAAFTLGRVALDQLDQPDRAARAFEVVLRERRPATLVHDARLRYVEALRRAGRAAEAEAAAGAGDLGWDPSSP